MTPDELRTAAIELFGQKGWTAKLAMCLHIERSTIYRYVEGQLPISGPVEAAVNCWLERFRSTGQKPPQAEGPHQGF